MKPAFPGGGTDGSFLLEADARLSCCRNKGNEGRYDDDGPLLDPHRKTARNEDDEVAASGGGCMI